MDWNNGSLKNGWLSRLHYKQMASIRIPLVSDRPSKKPKRTDRPKLTQFLILSQKWLHNLIVQPHN